MARRKSVVFRRVKPDPQTSKRQGEHEICAKADARRLDLDQEVGAKMREPRRLPFGLPFPVTHSVTPFSPITSAVHNPSSA